MKRAFAVLVCLWAFGVGPQLPARGADASEESTLIGVLQSPDASLQGKDAACARLKLIGTAQSVPALAALLTDDNLSHSARYALESMPLTEAGQALLDALGKTSASNQVGIIHSLAMRRETAAVPQLVTLLASADPDVAAAAAEGLGRIGGQEAITSLQTAAGSSTGEIHRVQIDALLAGANRLLPEDTQAFASTIFQHIYDTEKSDDIRLAAFRGLILASGPRGVALMTDAIAGADAPSQAAALQLAATVKDATAALADLLPKVPPPVQIALLQCLAQRGDPSASEAVAQLASSPNADVRLMAIMALGDVGDASVALPLAVKAATSTGVEKETARQALRDLRNGTVTAALVDSLDGAAPAVEVEVIGALGNRGDQSAVPKMLELTQSQTNLIRSAAFQALALLGAPAQIPDFVQIVVTTTNDDIRSQAADSLASICQRNQSKLTPSDAQAVVTAVQTAPLDARLALMPVCGALAAASARDALRAAMEDREPQVREAALRALCDTRDTALLPVLVTIACRSEDKKSRLLAIRGCVRLSTQDDGPKVSQAQKLDAFKMIMDTPLDEQEKRLVLSALGDIPDAQALALAVPMLDDSTVSSEAVQAVIRIAGSISAEHPAEARAALKRVLAMQISPATQRSAENALKKVH